MGGLTLSAKRKQKIPEFLLYVKRTCFPPVQKFDLKRQKIFLTGFVAEKGLLFPPPLLLLLFPLLLKALFPPPLLLKLNGVCCPLEVGRLKDGVCCPLEVERLKDGVCCPVEVGREKEEVEAGLFWFGVGKENWKVEFWEFVANGLEEPELEDWFPPVFMEIVGFLEAQKNNT